MLHFEDVLYSDYWPSYRKQIYAIWYKIFETAEIKFLMRYGYLSILHFVLRPFSYITQPVEFLTHSTFFFIIQLYSALSDLISGHCGVLQAQVF